MPGLNEIAPGVHLLTLGRGAGSTNVYLVRSGPRWVLVDAGWHGDARQIRAAAETAFGQGVAPAAIVLTHIHPDHSGAAGDLARSWGAPVHVHPDEVAMAAGRYLPEFSMPLDRWVVVPLMRLLPARVRRRAEEAGDITDVVRPLQAPGTVPGLPEWKWVATPGHTPGHVALVRRSDGVVLAGDAALTVNLNSVRGILLGRPEIAGPPRYTTWSWPAAMQSLEVLADLRPQLLAPGHGHPLSRPPAEALRAVAHRRRGRSPGPGRARRPAPGAPPRTGTGDTPVAWSFRPRRIFP